MVNKLERFEKIVRISHLHCSKNFPSVESDAHPFDERNIHPDIAYVASKLFDDGHYSQATFEAFKYVDKKVSKITNRSMSGFKLMMKVFNHDHPEIKLTALSNPSEVDEQKGFAFLFSGSVMAIRNPRGHEVGNIESLDECLDHLSFASFLLRRISKRISP